MPGTGGGGGGRAGAGARGEGRAARRGPRTPRGPRPARTARRGRLRALRPPGCVPAARPPSGVARPVFRPPSLRTARRTAAPPTEGRSGEAPSPGRTLRRSAAFAAVLAIALVATADALFYGRPVGWTLGLFFAAMIAAVVLRGGRVAPPGPRRLVLAASAGLLVALVDQPGPLVVAMAMLALLSLSSLHRVEGTRSVSAWLARWTETTLRCVGQLPRDLALVVRRCRARGGRPARGLRRLAVWGLPVLLTMVFVGLFAAANPVIEAWVQHAGEALGRGLRRLLALVRVERVLFWVGFALPIWSLLRAALRWPTSRYGLPEPPSRPSSEDGETPTRDVSPTLVRCLTLFNLVFAVQLSVDLVTWLSNGAVLPAGVSYGAYARRGAYPLVASALLAALFVLATFPSGPERASPTGAGRAMRWARGLVFLWIAQNVALTISAGLRLELYVRAFTLTRWRVAAAIWMLLVAIGLLTIVWRIARHRTNRWLVRTNAAALLAVLFAGCFVPFDAAIAWYDVRNCREAGHADGPAIDRRYLRGLGPEAILPLRWLERRSEAGELRTALRADADALSAELRAELRDWRGWTRRRARIAATAGD